MNRNSSTWNGHCHDDKNEILANLVSQKIEKLKDKEKQAFYKKTIRRNRTGPAEKTGPSQSQLIIIDRSFDLITPLVHEQTYQAMLADFCDSTDNEYEIDKTDDLSGPLMNEKDKLWAKYRGVFRMPDLG